MHRGSSTCHLLPFLALVLLAGCSRGPEGAAPAGPATAPSAGGPVFLATPPSPLGTPRAAGTQDATFATTRITARNGGSVQFGRFSVRIPRGALAADTDITVRDAGKPFVSCELEPHGTQFLVPVELEIDLKDLNDTSSGDWTIYWLADGNHWVDQGGIYSQSTGKAKVTAQLWHFSTYAPGRGGRAGW